jgi:diguanylate cyclase (GGDEF)-like protein
MNLDIAIDQLIEIVTQVRQSSFADDKTPLGNALALEKEIDLFKIGKSEFDVVVFGDLNDFKRLNDMHGHEAGNLAIEQVGKKIQEKLVQKHKSKAFRQSGDEFIILLKQTAIKTLHAKTQIFKSLKFQYKGKFLETKMSFGYVISDKKTDFTELIKQAEAACLIAKSQGDGTCVEWNRDLEIRALRSFRRNCHQCGSINRCDVPKNKNPEEIIICSFCGERFD